MQRALNRGENYNQLRRAVSHANFGKLRYRTAEEQVLWSECNRLLTNCIIYYNSVILSRILEAKLTAGDVAGAERLAHVSPVAWQHINFYGRAFDNPPASLFAAPAAATRSLSGSGCVRGIPALCSPLPLASGGQAFRSQP